MARSREQGREILAAPVRFEAVRDGKPMEWTAVRPARCRRKTSGKAQYRALVSAPGLACRSDVTAEMDGRIGIRLALEPDEDVVLDALRLVIELPADVSRYWLEPPPPDWLPEHPSKLGSTCPEMSDKPLSSFRFASVGDYNAGLGLSIAHAPEPWLVGHGGRFRQTRTETACRIELESERDDLQRGALADVTRSLELEYSQPPDTGAVYILLMRLPLLPV
mgnify:CR=1 FL=1